MLSFAVGATNTSLDVQFVDDEGLPVTGLVALTMPTLKYSKGRGSDTTISLSDLDGLDESHDDGGVYERGEGVYRLDVPNDVCASVAIVKIRGEASGKRLICPPIQVGLEDALVAAIGNAVISADSDDGNSTEPLRLKVGELGVTQSVTCLNADGETPRNLTLWGPKVLVIERPNRTADVQVVENADLTISGASNHVFTFQPSAAVLASKADYIWSLREVSSGEVIVEGRIAVAYAPLEDTP